MRDNQSVHFSKAMAKSRKQRHQNQKNHVATKASLLLVFSIIIIIVSAKSKTNHKPKIMDKTSVSSSPKLKNQISLITRLTTIPGKLELEPGSGNNKGINSTLSIESNHISVNDFFKKIFFKTQKNGNYSTGRKDYYEDLMIDKVGGRVKRSEKVENQLLNSDISTLIVTSKPPVLVHILVERNGNENETLKPKESSETTWTRGDSADDKNTNTSIQSLELFSASTVAKETHNIASKPLHLVDNGNQNHSINVPTNFKAETPQTQHQLKSQSQKNQRITISNSNTRRNSNNNPLRILQGSSSNSNHHGLKQNVNIRLIRCACDTPECLTNGDKTCLTPGVCYNQYLERNDGSSSITRGCIDEKTPLLCENRKPRTPRWPYLTCCIRDMCNAEGFTIPTFLDDSVNHENTDDSTTTNITSTTIHESVVSTDIQKPPDPKTKKFGGLGGGSPKSLKDHRKNENDELLPNLSKSPTSYESSVENGHNKFEKNHNLAEYVSPLATGFLVAGGVIVCTVSTFGFYILRREKKLQASYSRKDLDSNYPLDDPDAEDQPFTINLPRNGRSNQISLISTIINGNEVETGKNFNSSNQSTEMTTLELH